MNDEQRQYISIELFRIRTRLEELVDDINTLEHIIDEVF